MMESTELRSCRRKDTDKGLEVVFLPRERRCSTRDVVRRMSGLQQVAQQEVQEVK